MPTIADLDPEGEEEEEEEVKKKRVPPIEPPQDTYILNLGEWDEDGVRIPPWESVMGM